MAMNGAIMTQRTGSVASSPATAMTTLSVSIVHYDTPAPLFDAVLTALARDLAGSEAIACGKIVVIDNGGGLNRAALDALFRPLLEETPHGWDLLTGHGNVGFGAGHNLALPETDPAGAHLVLNPDVLIAPGSLDAAVDVLRHHSDAVLVTPRAEDEAGRPHSLCKRYPDVLTLGIRGFAPAWLKRRFARRIARYELQDTVEGASGELRGIPLAGGAFMLCRGQALLDVGGFDPGYFLYFEDFDLSLRLARHGTIVHAPCVEIVHYGGGAGGKGWRHRRAFIASGIRFFRRHGLKLA